jgi:hypothetical protein
MCALAFEIIANKSRQNQRFLSCGTRHLRRIIAAMFNRGVNNKIFLQRARAAESSFEVKVKRNSIPPPLNKWKKRLPNVCLKRQTASRQPDRGWQKNH